MTWLLDQPYSTPAQERPIRKLVMPPMNRKPPTQSTRCILDLNVVFAALSLTKIGTVMRPMRQKGNCQVG